MAVTYVTLYPPGGNSAQVQVVEGSQLHLIYASMGFSATPSAPGPPKRPDPFPQYVHDDEVGALLADAAVPATDPVVAALLNNTSSLTSAAARGQFETPAGAQAKADGAAAASEPLTVAGARAVRRGELVISVADYGATGSATDNTAAITAAITAATAAGDGCRLSFPRLDTAAAGYRVLSQITVPDGVNLDMSEARIIYAGTHDQPALVVGSGTRVNRRRHIIRITSETQSDWTDQDYVGVEIRSLYYSRVDLLEVTGFTRGAELVGVDTGFVYNLIDLGVLQNNERALVLTSRVAGWCNENKFFGGSFTVDSATHTDKTRYGVVITSENTTPYYQNANVFYGPSFEIRGNDGVPGVEGVAALVEYGHMNHIRDARHESPSAISLRTQNESQFNTFSTTYNATSVNATPVADDQGANPTSIVRAGSFHAMNESHRVIRQHQRLRQVACYYDGATRINVPGLAVVTSGTTLTPIRSNTGLVLGTDHVEVSASRALGFYVSTRVIKQFTLAVEVADQWGGRINVTCFDAAGTVLTSAGGQHPYVKGWSAQVWTYGTSFGGAYRTGTDSTGRIPALFTVGSAVDYVFVSISGGTNPAKLRAFSLTTAHIGVASTWLPYPEAGEENYGTTPPTAGTWEVGRRIWNATPTASGPAGWICTVAGTPGTWNAMANLAA